MKALGCWYLLVSCGFGYVAVVLCGRSNPLHSGNPGFADFIVLSVLCLLLYFVGPRHNWPLEPSANRDQILKHGLCYGIPLFLMLHWEYVGQAIGAHFSITRHHLLTLDLPSAIALALAVLTIASLLAYHLVLAQQASILKTYVGLLLTGPLMLSVITWFSASTHYLHVHHYCIGMFLFPFFRFHTSVSLTAQASFLGLAIEGVARWGMDPWWYPLQGGSVSS